MPSVSTSRVLARPGHADQQRVAARQQRDQRLIDHRALAEDDAADALAHLPQALAERFDLGDQLVGRGLVGGHRGAHYVDIRHAGNSIAMT